MTEQYPQDEMKGLKWAPNCSSSLSEGIETLEYRRLALQHFLAFEVVGEHTI